MKTLSDQLSDAGFKLTDKEETKVRESLREIKRSFIKKPTCRFCTEEIKFIPTDVKQLPHNLDGTPHWQTCPYSTFFQKKMSFNIMKKLAVFFTLKHGAQFEKDTALTLKEIQVVHAVLEREFRATQPIAVAEDSKVLQCDTEEEVISTIQKNYDNLTADVPGEIQFKPLPTDPIGDPDEDRAPLEKDIPTVTPLTSLEDLLSPGKP